MLKKLQLALIPIFSLVIFTAIASSQISIVERFVQIRSIDFENAVVEIHNFGTGTQSLTGWRFCSHDENQDRQYTGSNALNGMSIAAGESLFIHFNNDADAANEINRSSLGSFATPLDTTGAYAIQFYWRTPFGTGGNIADHVQLSEGGVDNTRADERSDEAQIGGVWANQSDWVNVQSDTLSIVLLTDSASNELHSPADYAVNNPIPFVVGDVNCDGQINLLDVAPFVDAISSGIFDPKADINNDTNVNLLDVQPFIQLLSGG